VASGGKFTAVVAAMPEEMAPLRARLGASRLLWKRRAGEIVAGELDGVSVVLAVTGTGALNARVGVAALLAAVAVERLIVIGAGGALSGDLPAGVLVVAELVLRAQDGDGDAGGAPRDALVERADASLVEVFARATGARRGMALTTSRLVDTALEKRRLHRLTVAATVAIEPRLAEPGTAAVVDLESAFYAAAARGAGVPWVVLRAVSDMAGEDLPALLNGSRDHGGAIRRARVARGLLARPALLPHLLPALLALRQRVLGCARALDGAVSEVLRSEAVSVAARSGRCTTR
jgi:adenosylhomocysteine nucleosidase